MMIDRGQKTSRLRAADVELVAYFTSDVGMQAQAYEPSPGGGGSGTSDGYHAQRIDEVACGAHRRDDRVRTTIAQLELQPRVVIERVYGRSAGTFERGAVEVALDVDLLYRALAPRWGHGSFLHIVHMLPRAQRAYERRHQRADEVDFGARKDARAPRVRVQPESMLEFLAREAQPDRAKETKGFFSQLVKECEETLRRPALIAYSVVRGVRVDRERDARRVARAARAAYVERLIRGHAA